jgi:hypothetical protein
MALVDLFRELASGHWPVTTGLALLAAVLLGCAPDPAPRPEEAGAFIARFFSAAEAGDCQALLTLLDGATPESCADFVEELRRRGGHLLEVREARRDGRDPGALLVTVRLEERGRPRELVFRLEERGGQWKLRL